MTGPSAADRYPPINSYAVIGDGRSAGLIGRDGSLDWLCLPRFDSPSLFAALLDSDVGGVFRICPTGDWQSERRYVPDTNVLETTFVTPQGTCVLRDLMPVAAGRRSAATCSPIMRSCARSRA
jgi:GH15 family glucan-1,4-alpha-glucosidase